MKQRIALCLLSAVAAAAACTGSTVVLEGSTGTGAQTLKYPLK